MYICMSDYRICVIFIFRIITKVGDINANI